MEWLATPCTFPPDSGPWTVAIGSFDGLHLGHQALLQRALAPPYSKGRLLLLSFHPHPRNLLSPQSVPLITPLPHRTALAKERGVHTIWAYPFSQETAQLSPSAFLDTALGSLSLTGLCVGWNFAFGNERLGNTDLLASWCASRLIPFLSFPPIKEGTQVITSSRIRRHLAQGDLKIVHRLLGRHFAIRGKVEKGAGRGKELGFPTINISLDPQQALPPSGVYKGRVLG
nr:hypothetical protein [bacterium]